MSEPLRGAVFSEEAYALGKVLDHSSWQSVAPKLDRYITPSDLDVGFTNLCFDGNGAILFCELSSTFRKWESLNKGQRLLYENFIKYATMPHCALLLHHSVSLDLGRKIDTRTDIDSYQLMIWDFKFVYSPVVPGNENYQRFVVEWVNTVDGPFRWRRFCLGKSVGL